MLLPPGSHSLSMLSNMIIQTFLTWKEGEGLEYSSLHTTHWNRQLCMMRHSSQFTKEVEDDLRCNMIHDLGVWPYRGQFSTLDQLSRFVSNCESQSCRLKFQNQVKI
jgi:hypothetical protein